MNKAFEKILERFEEEIEFDTFDLYKEEPLIHMSYEQFEDIVQEVSEESEEYKNGWIPVSERLPEKGGSYIVCSENKKVYLAYYCKNSVVPHWSRGKIIAWQPLPEPYQPKEE